MSITTTRKHKSGCEDVSCRSDEATKDDVWDFLMEYFLPHGRTSESIYQSDSAQEEGLELLVRIAERIDVTREEAPNAAETK